MSKLAQAQALAAKAAETGANMTEEVKGGGGRLLPVGYAFGRLVQYIEFGQQPQEFNGVAKDPALEVQLGFALSGLGYQNDDGTPYVVTPYPMALSQNAKSRAFKLFKALNWKGTATHFAELLGEAYLVKIVHTPKSATDKTLVSRIDLDGFLPPLDPVSHQPYAIQEARDEDVKVFLWQYPTESSWADLYREGKWDDGKSKNTLQETMLAACDFAGSALEAMLQGAKAPGGMGVPAVPPTVPTAAPAVPVVPTAPAAPVVPNDTPPFVPDVAPAPAAPVAPAAPTMPIMPNLPTLPASPVVANVTA